MILVDTGPLVAILDKDDFDHTKCVDQLQCFKSDVLITSWICITEAMYMLGKVGGIRYVSELWEIYQKGVLRIHDLTSDEINRMKFLMMKYHDTPMDLADASLIAIAESLSFTQIFSLDSDFHIYRLEDGTALEILPHQL